MAPQFHETVMGHRFFNSQLPELTKAINRLANGMQAEQSQTGNPMISQLSEATRNRLFAVMENGEKAEALAQAFTEQVMNDDENPARMGFYLAKAILDGNVEDLLIAVCGWKVESLLNLAECGSAYPKEDA